MFFELSLKKKKFRGMAKQSWLDKLYLFLGFTLKIYLQQDILNLYWRFSHRFVMRGWAQYGEWRKTIHVITLGWCCGKGMQKIFIWPKNPFRNMGIGMEDVCFYPILTFIRWIWCIYSLIQNDNKTHWKFS